MTETIFEEKMYFTCTFFFGLAHVPSANMEGAGYMTYNAARNQKEIKMFGFTYTLYASTPCFTNVGTLTC